MRRESKIACVRYRREPVLCRWGNVSEELAAEPTRGVDMRRAGSDGRADETVTADLVALVEAHGVGQALSYQKGRLLYWQGDPVESVFVLKQGAVKISSIAADGRVYTYGVLGPGGLLGVQELLAGTDHLALAEVLQDATVIRIRPATFRRLVETDPRLSLAVMKKLAESHQAMAIKIRDFGLVDVQRRLRSSLVDLARVYGVVTDAGIRIDLDITQSQIAEMVAANRTTITSCLSELRRQGYLWKEGRRLYILPPEHMEVLDNLDQAVVDGASDRAEEWAKRAIALRLDPVKALEALTSGMRRVDRLYAREEIDVTDVMLSAFAMKSAIPIIEEAIARSGTQVVYLGTVVIGTVQGDVHEIGRTIVSMLLKARGFRVIDLGVNVPTARFVEAVRSYRPQILAMSTLLSTTVEEPFKVIAALVREGLRGDVKVMVGGSAITQELSHQMGADGYEPSANRATELAWRLAQTVSRERPS